jgi:hypothetical protein
MPSISEIVTKNRSHRKSSNIRHTQLAIDASINDPDNYFQHIQIPHNVRNNGWIIIDTHSQPSTAFVNSNHKQYYNKQFKVGALSRMHEGSLIYELYPIVDREHDYRNIGYGMNSNSQFMHQLIPNKFESFWDTRHGKRFAKYIEYRKKRENTREEYKK